MRFQTPQFIEVEDKIFGPLTLKQFIYLAGGGALAYVFYKFLPFYIGILAVIPTLAFAFALAFYKVNNKPFIFLVESAIKFWLNKRLYIWKKTPHSADPAKREEAETAALYVPKLSDSRLRDLTWSLDVKQSINPVTGQNNKTNTF